MPAYQRMVSYLYEYRGGERSGNVGYVRLEIREDVAKMIISIRLRRDVSASCPVEFYYFEGGQAYGIDLGEVRMNGGRVEERLLLPGVSLGEYHRPVTEMSGVRILLPLGYLGSAWDEEAVPVECRRERDGQLPEKELQVAILPEEVEGGELWEPEPISEPEPESVSEPVSEPESEPEAASAPELTPEYFFQNGPRMCPFEDPAVTTCVRMEPADLEYLPREAWVLGSNSFLLHGYYTYGHLILAKMRGQVPGKESIILGVPGLNQSREGFLARLFGFEHFKSVTRSSTDQSEYGYWYMILSFKE